MENLKKYGTTERYFTEATLYPDLYLARIISESQGIYRLVTESGEYLGEVSGKFRFEAKSSDFPAVGDFVMVDRTDNKTGNLIIHKVLTRKSIFERKDPGSEHISQILASNIDFVFLCMSLNNNYSLNRLERYMSVAWNSGAVPVIILTKSDLCNNLTDILKEVSDTAPAVDIITTCRDDKDTVNKLLSYLKPGVTASFIGSSGVGKSTLINLLLGKDTLSTSGIRDDDKGRHTTTRRELLVLPQGGVVIDTPGIRELGLDTVDLSKSFADIESLIGNCKFRNCTHTSEPGCAILEAIESGKLDERRFENYKKIEREAKYSGLSSRQLENEKFKNMFNDVGGMKKIRKYIRENDKRKR